MQWMKLFAGKAWPVIVLLPLSAQANWLNSLDWPPKSELSHVLVQTSLYTRHFSPDPEHTNRQRLISLELHNHKDWLVGAARFKNSFDQDSVYFYAGKSWSFWEQGPHLEARAKLTAGALHGYRGEYRDKIPFNRFEIAPAILPSVGLRWHRLETDLIIFGTAGMMVTGGIRF